jgi:hypothetical protein
MPDREFSARQSLEELATCMARSEAGSAMAHLYKTEFLLRQTQFAERQARAAEEGARAAERAADATKEGAVATAKYARYTLWILISTALAAAAAWYAVLHHPH